MTNFVHINTKNSMIELNKKWRGVLIWNIITQAIGRSAGIVLD